MFLHLALLLESMEGWECLHLGRNSWWSLASHLSSFQVPLEMKTYNLPFSSCQVISPILR